MSVELNHTIIPTRDKWESAKFLADILNLEAGPPERAPHGADHPALRSSPRAVKTAARRHRSNNQGALGPRL